MKNVFVFLFSFSILTLFFLATNTAYSQAFRTTWKTTDSEITIPTNDSLEYDYKIIWKNLTNRGVGNGSAKNQKGNYTIKNLENGSTYEIAIIGKFPHFFMDYNKIEKVKLQTLEEWGTIQWQSMNHAFMGCINLTYKATDSPDLRKVKNLSYMFYNCNKLDGNSTMNKWNTSTITDMSGMFKYADSFNQPIGDWDMQNVTNTNQMFNGAALFNQPIGDWNTENVTDMGSMFYAATSFNQPIGKWNIQNVINMSALFYATTSFNQPIEKWNTKNVIQMDGMFYKATSFNQPLEKWNTSKVTDMSYMFYKATSFNQSIGNWNTQNVENMRSMFDNATSFNQPIGEWNTQNVTTMKAMFYIASSFNQSLGNWNTEKVKDMSEMFYYATSFNQPIEKWNTKNVTDMRSMFYVANAFNQSIEEWNTEKVRHMSEIFYYAAVFNQPIGKWNISNIKYNDQSYEENGLINIFEYCGMNKENYDATLIGWANNKNAPKNITLTANGLKYCKSKEARQKLIKEYGWTIEGDELDCED
ncbi:BspA family leucine-rich repeat surface protein [Bernardetia sp. ABR2-2B]|uniref:BspA family leucine-rich repeat surface protein n=1 Tax=Bernardetia sp. ABR2-2B TaxID=3127472 RepID=UPI0030CC9A18